MLEGVAQRIVVWAGNPSPLGSGYNGYRSHRLLKAKVVGPVVSRNLNLLVSIVGVPFPGHKCCVGPEPTKPTQRVKVPPGGHLTLWDM